MGVNIETIFDLADSDDCNDCNGIETTPEYFARIAEDEMNVKKATDFLNKFGIQVKTEYGNYRPLYDVLADIGNAMSRA